MKIKIIGEFGYEQALYGLGLSYGLTSDSSFNDFNNDIEMKTKLGKIAFSLTPKDKGHNKFLEHIMIWLDVTAPRYWWAEADTYRISSKQSESTIHTLMSKHITESSFEGDMDSYNIERLEKIRCSDDMPDKFDILKNYLPEGFLQKREWVLSYKELRNIIIQRRKHKLEQWRQFCDYIIIYSKHKELFSDLKY